MADKYRPKATEEVRKIHAGLVKTALNVESPKVRMEILNTLVEAESRLNFDPDPDKN